MGDLATFVVMQGVGVMIIIERLCAINSEKLQECDNVGFVLCGEAAETELSASKPEKRVIVLHHSSSVLAELS